MMAAVASQRDDSQHCDSADQAAAQAADPAEAPMSEADFQVIERAHQLCDHPAARELPAEPQDKISRRLENWNLDEQRVEQALIAHASKILRAQIRAGEIVRAMAQKTTCLVELLVADETDEVVIDWAQAAQDAWHGESWKVAAMDYRIECRKQRGVRR